tara:strand:+ start:6327 stop:6911 length:585 start_codon:yes stop_codon:yes gene_type:complete
MESRAHPHAWIDMSSSVTFDRQSRIRSIVVDWLFDDFYTAFVVEDINRVGEPLDDALASLAKENLSNLKEYGYFVDVQVDDQRQKVEFTGHFETEIRDDRLWLRFEIALPEPVDPHRQTVSYAVYDPTYYIEILHLEGDVVTLRGEKPSGCFASIVPATPTGATIAMAAALDQNEKAPDTLGLLFAETVEILCD